MNITCCVTGATKDARASKDGSPALPPGWKRLGDQVYSPDGWHAKFILRSARLPIASVEVEDKEQGWKDLRAALRTAWTESTHYCNWAMTALAKADDKPLERTVTKKGYEGFKLPKFTPPDLYTDGRRLFPNIDSQSLGSLRQKALAKYRHFRFDLRVRCAVSLPTFRYPVPLPVPSKDAVVELNDQKQPFVSCRFATGQRFRVRLRNGPEFRRQIGALQAIAAGEGLQGEVSFYEQLAGDCNRNGGEHRRQPGANRRPTRLMAAVAVWLPKTPCPKEDRALLVKTSKDRLWSVYLADHGEWNLNADEAPQILAAINQDQLLCWIAEHAIRLNRLNEDRKAERRMPKAERADINSLLEDICTKQRRRLDNACHNYAAMLAGFARRQRVSVVQYDDSEKGFAVSFPYFKLRTLVEQKLREIDVKLEVSTASDADEPLEILEST